MPFLPSGYYDCPLEPDGVRVIQYGISRSGSTAVWQIVRDLVGEGVVKTHAWIGVDTAPVVATVRDFRDVAVSHWWFLGNTGELTHQGAVEQCNFIDQWIEVLRRYTALPHLLIRYPPSMKHAEAIAAFLCSCGIPATGPVFPHDIETNRIIAANVPEKAHDPVTLLNRNHVRDGRCGMWRQYTCGSVATYLTDRLKPHLKEFGYDI